MIEHRAHNGGNVYDENGRLNHRDNPHSLNTNKYYVIKFLSQYAEPFHHVTKLLCLIDGIHVRFPFNFETMRQLIGAEKSENIMTKLWKEKPVKCLIK